jgi:hypothetical protein
MRNKFNKDVQDAENCSIVEIKGIKAIESPPVFMDCKI